ncbi:hypothetical protein M408DRAFT_106189 [Serendipita vermifera MAFF 305830]|uniref:Uncharacterized protein n=1 Tax=Serendipita vermifera MAFF 305830 TaxID=933852 RepID=A0A0C3BC76_SERVB|nr:hypothetical protein M408DRAFT_106189 [Serendipita vermifera MAFF 305830]
MPQPAVLFLSLSHHCFSPLPDPAFKKRNILIFTIYTRPVHGVWTTSCHSKAYIFFFSPSFPMLGPYFPQAKTPTRTQNLPILVAEWNVKIASLFLSPRHCRILPNPSAVFCFSPPTATDAATFE